MSLHAFQNQQGKRKKDIVTVPQNKLRWGVLGLTVIGFLCGFTFIVGLLDPYSAYGRVVVHIFKPIYMLGNNLLESVFSKFDNYTFYQVDTSVLSISSLLIAVITLAIIFVMAWKHGRTWCNTVCPVGTVLGLLSRFHYLRSVSILQNVMDAGFVLPNAKPPASIVRNMPLIIAAA